MSKNTSKFTPKVSVDEFVTDCMRNTTARHIDKLMSVKYTHDDFISFVKKL